MRLKVSVSSCCEAPVIRVSSTLELEAFQFQHRRLQVAHRQDERKSHDSDPCIFYSYTDVFQVVEWAFGKRLTDKERMRKQQRSLDKMIRELDRDKVKLENESKKLIAEMTKNAKAGQMGAARIQAKDLIRKRA